MRAGAQPAIHGVWRVDGLAVSRALGDKKLKAECPAIICDPVCALSAYAE